MRKDLLAGLAFLGVGIAVIKRNIARREREEEEAPAPTWETDPWGMECLEAGGTLIDGGAACQLPGGEVIRR
jgi:hypothetical protein